MFHVAEALLLSRGLTYSKHSGVIAGLHEHFVRTGELSREHFDAFRKAFEVRSTADYEYLEPFPVGSARGLIGRAEDLRERSASAPPTPGRQLGSRSKVAGTGLAPSSDQ